MSIQDQLASTCHNFMRILRVRNEYFLIAERNKGVKVGQAVHEHSAIRYSADSTFIKKYSSLFALGEVFQWNNSTNFYNWLRSILIANPRFIEPHLRSLNALFAPPNADVNLAPHQPSWFISYITHIHTHMKVKIPKNVMPFLCSPRQAVAIVNSGNRRWFVKLKNVNLREGWHDLRCYVVLTVDDLQKLKMPDHFKNSFQVHGRQEFTLVCKDRKWVVQYVDGCITGDGWTQFLQAHLMIAGDILVLALDMYLHLHSMVFGWNDCIELQRRCARLFLQIQLFLRLQQYPLLFPLGEPGWHQGIKKVSEKQLGAFSRGQGSVLPIHSTTSEDLIAAESLVYEENSTKENMVSAREFYAYRFQIRPSIDSVILQSGRLLQQFAVDMYVKIETSRLDYFRNKQDEIRADLYQGIIDSISKGECRGEKIGKRIILQGGPTSFEDLRTVQGTLYSTYREAALAYGLLKDDLSNEKCLEEASFYCMPISLRQLFCTILMHCNAMNPKQLFLKFEDSLKEDFAKRELMSDNEARQCLLQALKSELESMGRKLSDFGLHDLLHVSTETTTVYKEIQDEKNIRISEIDLQNSANLNKEQLIAFNDILEAVTFEKPMSFFIDGPGGTGKTFLYPSLLAVVRSQNLIALATATSGVAASILPNGRTAHSRFKIPIDGEGRLSCNMTSNMKMLKDIVPGVPNWTAEVMVIEKGLPRLAKNKRLYQKLVFIDSEGSKIQGTIFQQDMRFLKNTLKIYHTYRISIAIINDTPAQHQVIDNDHEWVLYARTPIEEVAVKELSITALKYNFVPLADLTKYTKSREGIDAIFAVLKVGAPKKTKETWVQNILIIDQGSNFILIVTTTNLAAGVKLQTRGSTTFIFDPVLPEANALKTWRKCTGFKLCAKSPIGTKTSTICPAPNVSRQHQAKLTLFSGAITANEESNLPQDSEFCLFSIDTFVPVTKIIEDTQELHLVLQATTAQKNHYNKEGETKSPATQLRASYTAAQDAVATKASKTAIIEDATAPGKNSNNHHTSNNQ
ncbi:hypothetical protein RHGRI_027111 [Rhododendron griersonianum]|uniref:ATP-dependent DNA helicase n=1 Tax=Rhododendron griersonianum TaxID=479676 RepID=A0AAV6IWL0_9ERIC|nr:hypothetical protein RHGRI_027111 [Rhododendron griersonianum]